MRVLRVENDAQIGEASRVVLEDAVVSVNWVRDGRAAFLAAEAAEHALLLLDLGADDYLVKPFKIGELEARMRAVLRRHHGSASPRFGNAALELDPVMLTAWRGGVGHTLAAREYAPLHVPGAAPALERAAASLGLALNVFEWTVDAERADWPPDAGLPRTPPTATPGSPMRGSRHSCATSRRMPCASGAMRLERIGRAGWHRRCCRRAPARPGLVTVDRERCALPGKPAARAVRARARTRLARLAPAIARRASRTGRAPRVNRRHLAHRPCILSRRRGDTGVAQ